MNRTAFKIAIREARASAGKFAFVLLAVAAGVGSLTGVRGFSEAFRGMLLKQARTLMAADVSVRIFALPSDEQQRTIARLGKQGVEVTRVTETISMAASDKSVDPVLVTLKAVDPRVFPFYGTLTLLPAGSLRDKLRADTVLVSEDLSLRMDIHDGDTLRVGGQPFTVAGIITQEPDRMSGSFSVGPRVMISREGLDRTGLIGPGSRASQRLLLRLGPGAPAVSEVVRDLRRAFPEALIVDFRETNPNIARGLDRATTFLSLVSLIALIVGAIGVATGMHAHLQSKLDNIAIMKSVGARSGQIIRIYLIQTVMLGLAGGLIGVLVGVAVEQAFPLLIERYFQVRPDGGFNIATAAQGVGLGILTSLLFTLPPLLSIRTMRPNLIFRRDMPETKPTWREWLRSARLSIAAAATICVGLAGIAAWLVGGSWNEALRIGGYFVGGLLVSLLILSAVATLLLRALRLIVRRAPLPITLRHAFANLYRPGSQSQAILTALGVGVMFTLTVYLVQRSVLQEIARSAPPGMANVFFIDISAQQRDELAALIRRSPGVEHEPEILPAVSAKIVSVDGTPIEQMNLTGGFARRFRSAMAITTADRLPEGVEVTSGAFWQGTPATAQVSVSASTARVLDVRPGSSIIWNAYGRTIPSTVAAVHRADAQRLRANISFTMSPGFLDGLPTVYYGAAKVNTPAIPALQRAVFTRFPTVTVVNIADILDRVQEVVDQIAVVVRFISAFTILAGAIILASSVAGTRFRRVREVVIFKTLGATRLHIMRMMCAEFVILGSVAGLMGSVLATAFSALVLNRLFDAPFRIDLVPNLLSVPATALIAAAAGWLASYSILGQKPLEILRSE